MPTAKTVLFIHRSVGQNLLNDGGLKGEIERAAGTSGLSLIFKDINNNSNHEIPGPDTKPSDYAKYFSNHSLSEDLVIIKSCYPNSAIESDAKLDELKLTYESLIQKFKANSLGKLLILTTPPLRPGRTNQSQAYRARALATWLTELPADNRVRVFDFYSLLAEPAGHAQANMLKKQYRRLFPWDNHPTKAASQMASPLMARAVADFLTP